MSKKIETLVEIEEGELDFSKAKVKVSMWIDGAILEAIKLAQKEKTGSEKGCQTFMHQKLSEIFLESRDQNAVKFAELERRLALLEKVFVSEYML